VARKTARLAGQLKAAEWRPSPDTDADGESEFFYQPEGWGKACRFLALRYEKEPEAPAAGQPEQLQLFETEEYIYRVFVTNMDGPLDAMVWFYNQGGGAGLTAHPSNRWAMNAIHFQIAMLAYNLNCWLLLFQREGGETAETLRHTTLATSRLKFEVSGRQNQPARRAGECPLQRSLRREESFSKIDDEVAGRRWRRRWVRACRRQPVPVLTTGPPPARMKSYASVA